MKWMYPELHSSAHQSSIPGLENNYRKMRLEEGKASVLSLQIHRDYIDYRFAKSVVLEAQLVLAML